MLEKRLGYFLLPAAILTVFWYLFWRNLAVYGCNFYDEFLTYARTMGVVESGDLWAVYENGEPTFRKPPLQYWLGAALVARGFEPEFAVKFWPVSFAVGLLLCLALLIRYLAPDKPMAVPVGLLLMGSSVLFVFHSRMGMLDTGFAFFILCANFLALLAIRENRRWWIPWGVICGLGALQKAPVAILTSILVVVFYREKHFWKERFFLGGAGISVAMALVWPIVQWLRFGRDYLVVYGGKELDRFGLGFGGRGTNWLWWLVEDNLALWIICFAVIAVAARKAQLQDRVLLCLLLPQAILLAYCTVSKGPGFPRYLLTVSPTILAVVSVLLCRLISSQPLPLLLACSIFFSRGEYLGPAHYRTTPLIPTELRAASIVLGRLADPGEEVLVCLRDRSPVVTAYCRAGGPIRFLSPEEIDPKSGPYILLVESATKQELDSIADLTPVARVGGYEFFRAP